MKIITFGIIAFLKHHGWEEFKPNYEQIKSYPRLDSIPFSKGDRVIVVTGSLESLTTHHLDKCLLSVPFISIDSGLFRYFVET